MSNSFWNGAGKFLTVYIMKTEYIYLEIRGQRIFAENPGVGPLDIVSESMKVISG
jgi:hypothetical protein